MTWATPGTLGVSVTLAADGVSIVTRGGGWCGPPDGDRRNAARARHRARRRATPLPHRQVRDARARVAVVLEYFSVWPSKSVVPAASSTTGWPAAASISIGAVPARPFTTTTGLWFDVMYGAARYRMAANELAVPRMDPGRQRPIESIEEARQWERFFIGEIQGAIHVDRGSGAPPPMPHRGACRRFWTPTWNGASSRRA